ncbi:MAG TPA: hypothetical protein VK901_16220, partial [Nitrospiraceae bacterium]|nr:hypothetical protein [Nitrospiraceae bacterium]
HCARRTTLSLSVIDLSPRDKPVHRGSKYPQTALANLGGSQSAFLDPSVDRPFADLQQLRRFLDAE